MALALLEQDTSQAAQNARQQIKQLIGKLPERHVKNINAHLHRPPTAAITFGDACIWADAVRDAEAAAKLDGDHENTESWHFVNVLRTEKAVSKFRCLVGCALVGLEVHAQVILDPLELNRTMALFYLAHWIGDVHQPLHISFADDLGGNNLAVTGIGGCEDQNQTLNMHSLWDTCMITKQMESNSQLVADLIAGLPSSAVMQTWQADPIETWANESLAVSLDPQTGYCKMASTGCLSPGASVALTNAYVVTNFPVLQLRMQKAAVRMAGMLKQLLGN
jgi:hypothetical protein